MPENSTDTTMPTSFAKRGGGGDRRGFAGSAALAALRKELRGDVRADALSRGLYSTDASIYQVRPAAVVLPRCVEDIEATLHVARQEGLPVTPRGAGTSQGGQAIGAGLVVDTSQGFARVHSVDAEAQTAVVEPGVVLDHLNDRLAPEGLWFPVDVATSSRATLGGMAGNNSAGGRSIRYGMMADNVRAIDALLADGTAARFGQGTRSSSLDAGRSDLIRHLRQREAEELAARVPSVMRHVAGYALHKVGEDGSSLANLVVGSEGTLAFFTRLELALTPRPAHHVLAVCHFANLHEALAAVAAVVELEPSAVELTDGALIELARANPSFAPRVRRFVEGSPGALLFVEFSGDDRSRLLRSLDTLARLDAVSPGPVVRAESPALQAEVWAVRKAGMNIVMSGPELRKPVSVIEDCAIPLNRLAEWGDRLGGIFRAHGVEGTWYAHASVGCLHVRPSLNLRDPADVGLLRAIAEQAHEVVRDLGGSHSGEHGDGRLRSEFIEPMLGPRLVRAFEEIKEAFDPEGVLNPGVITNPVRMDDRTSFRYGPDYRTLPVVSALRWPGPDGLLAAVERCNNNGACRKRDPGVMCPSFRATRDEVDTPRGRANTLRLALTGQLGPSGLASKEVHAALDLCVGCKACRRECPTGVDVSRLKTEALAQRYKVHAVSLRTRLLAHLPRSAPRLSRFGGFLNRAGALGMARAVASSSLGLGRSRTLPQWSANPFQDHECPGEPGSSAVGLFADTFNRWFEPENLRAAVRVLGFDASPVRALSHAGRPLCCGRTYLSAGLVEEARDELLRTASVLVPFIESGGTIVGLEPSCLLTFRDEAAALLPADQAEPLARGTMLLEEYLSEARWPGSEATNRRVVENQTAHVHGHCHQKAFDTHDATLDVLARTPGVDVRAIRSGCCGMAGSFGYEREHEQVSRAMAYLDLVPALASVPLSDSVVADGFSCRHQIADLSHRTAVHSVRLLDRSLPSGALQSAAP